MAAKLLNVQEVAERVGVPVSRLRIVRRENPALLEPDMIEIAGRGRPRHLYTLKTVRELQKALNASKK